jgi:hypothetical protein
MKTSGIKKRYKIFFGLILFIAILLFAAPRLARWYIVKNSPELIGRKLAIEKIRLNYFNGMFRINNLQLFESDTTSVFASFKQLKINFKLLPLIKNEIYVKNFSLDDPYVQVLQNGDKFNFSTLFTSDTLTHKKDTVPGKPLKYFINDLRINRGSIKYTDERLNNTIALDKLDLNIPAFTWKSDSTKLGLDLRFVEGGGLNSSLALNLDDSTYSVNLKLDSINLDIIEPYVRNYMNISDLHGYFSNDIYIKGNMRSILQIFIRGVNHINDFQLIDPLKRPILSFKDLTMDIDSLQLDRSRINLKYIGLTNPVLLFEMIDTTNNWLKLLKNAVETKPENLQQKPDAASDKSKGSFAFTKLQISEGMIHFSNKTLRFPFDYTIDKLKIESSPVRNISGKFSINVSAGLNNSGSLIADASLNPSDLKDLDISLSIKQFRMKDMDAYFKHYFGFPVTGGIMNFKTENRLKSATLVSNNALYFRKFTLGEPRLKESEYHIPLRLALGLLSDKDGIINLKAPVEMKGEEVKVHNLWKIIFKVIGDLFIKAAVSPAKMLSGLFKVDPSSLQQITLGLTEPSPDEKNLKSVDLIADILNKKPALNIDLVYCLDIKKSTDTLAYISAIEDYIKYSKSAGDNMNNVPDSTLVKYLLSKDSSATNQGAVDLLSLCRKYAGDEKLKVKIDSIKTMQTEFMKNYLGRDKELPSDRFRIIVTAPDTIKYDAAYPSFKIYFTASGGNQE